MARETAADDVTMEMAREALQMQEQFRHEKLDQLAQFHHYLTSVEYFMYSMVDNGSHEHNPDFMSHIRANNPQAWDSMKRNLSDLIDMVVEFAAEERPEAVCWTLEQ